MSKLAIFVEGQTELLFIDRLITEIANKNSLFVEHYKASGGKIKQFTMKPIGQAGDRVAQRYVQIVDCGSDENVKSYILERHTNLASAQFWGVIGIRDVSPNSLTTKSLLYGQAWPKACPLNRLLFFLFLALWRLNHGS